MVVSATGIKQQRPLRERSGSNAFHAEIAESMNAEIADYILLNSPRLCASAAKKIIPFAIRLGPYAKPAVY